MKSLVYLFFILVGFIGIINCASSTGKVTTRNTPPRTSPRPTQRTSTNPRYSYCYSCQYQSCPVPFRSNSAYVSRDISPSGWCAKISDSAQLDSRASRAIGVGYCSSRGCSWRMVGGVNKYVCCCYGNLCNSALTSAQSSIFILVLSFIMISLTKNYFY